MGIIFTIVILGLIVFLHELGHFATAKYFRMPVTEFAIGMGPKIFSLKKNETTYSIRILPLGGFVNIEGMQPERFDLEVFKKEKMDEIIEELKNETGNKYNDNEIEDEIFVDEVERRLSKVVEKELKRQENIQKNGFFAKSPFSRFVVLIAGVVMNFISALVVLFIILSVAGVLPPKYSQAIVGGVEQSSKVNGRLKVNDKILAINGKNISNWSEMTKRIGEISKNYKNEDIALKILRDNKEITENVKLTYNKEVKGNILGVHLLRHISTFGERV